MLLNVCSKYDGCLRLVDLSLWALSLNLAFTILFVFLLRDPGVLKSGQGGKNRAANPRSVTAFNGCIWIYKLRTHTLRMSKMLKICTFESIMFTYRWSFSDKVAI